MRPYSWRGTLADFHFLHVHVPSTDRTIDSVNCCPIGSCNIVCVPHPWSIRGSRSQGRRPKTRGGHSQVRRGRCDQLPRPPVAALSRSTNAQTDSSQDAV